MIEKLFSILNNYQERMHRKSKLRFRKFIEEEAKKLNLAYQIFPNSFACKNIVVGD